MSRIDDWATGSLPNDWVRDRDLSIDLGELINDKPTTITVIRAGVARDPQTVRIEGLSSSRQALSPAGQVFTVDAVIIGYKGYPPAIDTDLKPGDRFVVAGVRYEVIMLIPGLTDSLQAYAKVIA